MKITFLVMMTALIALAGCIDVNRATALFPTPEQICALPPDVFASLLKQAGSTPEDMAAACMLIKK